MNEQLQRKLDKLKRLILLTDDSVSDVEMNELTMRQWKAFIEEFPDEASEPAKQQDGSISWVY